MDKESMCLSLIEIGQELLETGLRNEAIEKFDLALRLKKGQPSALISLLRLYFQNKDLENFLLLYYQQRPFLSMKDGEPFDREIANLAGRWEQISASSLRRTLGLILFQQGDERAEKVLASLDPEEKEDPEVVRALASMAYFKEQEKYDLGQIEGKLSSLEFSELKTCLQREMSPTLLRNLEALACVVCGSEVTLSGDKQTLSCSSCGKRYPIVQGIPQLLEKPLKEYLDIEPQYWESFKPANMQVRSPFGLESLWSAANMPWPSETGDGIGDMLQMIYKVGPHWMQMAGFFLDHVGDDKPARVLDVGCGVGHDIYALSRLFPEHDYFGMDIVFSGCLTAQRFKCFQQNQFICADAQAKFPFKDNAFDFVLSHNSIEHCGKAMMDEIYRILRPGGKAFIAGPSGKSYAFLAADNLNQYVNIFNSPGHTFLSHGLRKEEYMEAFRKFRLIRHDSDNYFFRMILESKYLNDFKMAGARDIFHEFCDVLGAALNQSDEARWYNYIQMFTLLKEPD